METIRENRYAALVQAGYREACDQLRHHREIDAIARELQRPACEIADIYAELYAELKARAQVTDYLPVLVARKVRAHLRSNAAAR
jgi:phytoene/squalene synthetase